MEVGADGYQGLKQLKSKAIKASQTKSNQVKPSTHWVALHERALGPLARLCAGHVAQAALAIKRPAAMWGGTQQSEGSGFRV